MSTLLPSDVLGQVVNHIDDYSDVLNVALSNKALYSVVVPYHLHFRDLRTRLHNPALWSWLSRLDDLRAAQIRSLTILPDADFELYTMTPTATYDLRERMAPELAPFESRPLTVHQDLDACCEAELNLVSALKRMSCLRRFRWYHVPRPLIEGTDDVWSVLQRLGTVRELDILDVGDNGIEVPPVAISETFLRFSSLTSLRLRVSTVSQPNEPEIPQLQQLLLTNVPDLEVLSLELDLNEQMDGTANIDHLLRDVLWPKLRVLRLRGVNCRAPELTRFLVAHPRIEELSLAQMMPGHAWTRLELPRDALPNLRHLECSSAQAAALLRNAAASGRPLETLLGIEVHDTVIDSKYFSWDDEWEDEDHDDADEEQPSPWKALLLQGLQAQSSITRLGISSIGTPEEMETLAAVSPQVKDLSIHIDRDSKIPDIEWHRLYSLFPALEVIRGGNLIWFDTLKEALTTEEAEKANVQIQALAQSCPRLRLILIGFHTKKMVILRDAGQSEANAGVRWVIRDWEENEDPIAKDGELVYNP